jgi:hypothetical protein
MGTLQFEKRTRTMKDENETDSTPPADSTDPATPATGSPSATEAEKGRPPEMTAGSTIADAAAPQAPTPPAPPAVPPAPPAAPPPPAAEAFPKVPPAKAVEASYTLQPGNMDFLRLKIRVPYVDVSPLVGDAGNELRARILEGIRGLAEYDAWRTGSERADAVANELKKRKAALTAAEEKRTSYLSDPSSDSNAMLSALDELDREIVKLASSVATAEAAGNAVDLPGLAAKLDLAAWGVCRAAKVKFAAELEAKKTEFVEAFAVAHATELVAIAASIESANRIAVSMPGGVAGKLLKSLGVATGLGDFGPPTPVLPQQMPAQPPSPFPAFGQGPALPSDVFQAGPNSESLYKRAAPAPAASPSRLDELLQGHPPRRQGRR